MFYGTCKIIRFRIFDRTRRLFLALSPPFHFQSRSARVQISRCIATWRRAVSVFYQINSRPIRRAIFTGSPHKRLLYSTGGYSPGENAAAPDGHGPRNGLVLSQSTFPLLLWLFFSSSPSSGMTRPFLSCARARPTATDISACINSRFSTKNCFSRRTVLSRQYTLSAFFFPLSVFFLFFFVRYIQRDFSVRAF